MAKAPKSPQKKTKPPAKTTAVRATVALGDEDAPNANPSIDSPANTRFIPPGVDLTISCSTNRTDLRYIVTFADTNPPPGPLAYDVPAPSSGNFMVVVAGANVVAGRTYTINVRVNPLDGTTPPHLEHTITVRTTRSEEAVVVRTPIGA